MKRMIQKLKARSVMLRQDRELFRMAKRLAEALPGRTYIVGGFVRDALLGIRSKDIDVEVYDVDADTLVTTLKKLFGDRVNVVGASFQTWKVHLDERRDMDVSLPRKESKTGKGHKGFKVKGDPSLSIQAATKRRDFTINAMLYDPVNNKLLDLFDGRDDLKNGWLRMINESTFIEDPLRVYRAVQFAARFKLTVEKHTKELLKSMVHSGELDNLSKERVTTEMKKLLFKAEKPSVGFELMREIGLIAKYYPELLDLIDTPQEPEWHPEGDVWIHTMMVVDEAAKIIHSQKHPFTETEALAVMLGALCHDLGKPATTKLGEKHGVPRIRSLGHSRVGLGPARALLSNFAFGERVQEGALACTLEHLKPGQLYFAREREELTKEQYDNAVRKMVKKHYPVPWYVILACAEADFRGRDLPDALGTYHAGELFKTSVLKQALDKEPVQPLIRGEDLKRLGMNEGPRMGELLRLIEDERDRGRIKTRRQAMERAKKELS